MIREVYLEFNTAALNRRFGIREFGKLRATSIFSEASKNSDRRNENWGRASFAPRRIIRIEFPLLN